MSPEGACCALRNELGCKILAIDLAPNKVDGDEQLCQSLIHQIGNGKRPSSSSGSPLKSISTATGLLPSRANPWAFGRFYTAK
jgi:hypothetical protein